MNGSNCHKYRKYEILTALIIFIMFSGGLEIILRENGYRLSKDKIKLDSQFFVFMQDPVLGWKNKPGIYAKCDSEYPIRFTIWSDGSRATRKERGEKRKKKKVIMLGCSFVTGWNLSDSETFPFKVQERMSDTDIMNYGTAGYGTYQSLLLLKSIRVDSPSSTIVLYGLCEFHEDRNVALSPYLRIMWEYGSRGNAKIPYCGLDSQRLLRYYPPISYEKWCLADSLAIIDYLEVWSHYYGADSWKRRTKEDVTKKLIGEMNNYCLAKEMKFIVVILSCNEVKVRNYMKYFRDADISYLDCSKYKISKFPDGHPDSAANSIWADSIAEYLGNSYFHP